MRAIRIAALILPMLVAAQPAKAQDEAQEEATALAKQLSDADAGSRLSAASKLWILAGKSPASGEAARPAFMAAVDDPDGAVAMNAAGALSNMKEPAEALAPARRRVLRERGQRSYIAFLAARGLIGIDPPITLAPALLDYLEDCAAAAKRGGSRENVQLARQALERAVDTKDRAILAPIRDQLRVTRAASAVLLPILHRFSPRPDDWTGVLLDHTGSADRDTASTAWRLLGDQDDSASLARWTPRAATALAVAASREDAMRALGRVAGRTTTGLTELAAVSADRAVPDDDRVRALEILGKAADARETGHPPDAVRAAKAQWLAACEPVLKSATPGKYLDACTWPAAYALPDGKERARFLAQALAANPDPAAKVELLGRLEGMWSEAIDVTDTVRAELANSEPRVKQAAEKALDRIRPAWRESGARQARQATAPAPAKAAAPTASGPGADGPGLYAAVRVGDVAKVRKLLTRANVLQPVRFPPLPNPPLPLVVAVNYCGIPTVTPAQLAEIVAHMVSLGADPEAKDPQGNNLFDRAKQACPPEVVKALGG